MFVHGKNKEINIKIVYCGPGLGGKTTNVRHIYNKTGAQTKSKLTTTHGEDERTLFFDFLPMELGKIRGFKVRLHLFTVPGQVFYANSRKLILRGLDGIIFVADSQIERMDENIKSFASLKQHLKEQEYDIRNVPLIFQWNKRDLPNIVSIKDLNKHLNEYGNPAFEAVATEGNGVFECLKRATKMVLTNVEKSLEGTRRAL